MYTERLPKFSGFKCKFRLQWKSRMGAEYPILHNESKIWKWNTMYFSLCILWATGRILSVSDTNLSYERSLESYSIALCIASCERFLYFWLVVHIIPPNSLLHRSCLCFLAPAFAGNHVSSNTSRELNYTNKLKESVHLYWQAWCTKLGYVLILYKSSSIGTSKKRSVDTFISPFCLQPPLLPQ